MKRVSVLFMLFMLIPTAYAADPSFYGHSAGEVNFNQGIPEDVRISGATRGWGTWNYVLQFTNPNHAMIRFKETGSNAFKKENLGFGMHSNGNFYYYDIGSRLSMMLSSAGDLTVPKSITVKGSTAQARGQKVCLQNGQNCPNRCGGRGEGQEWTVSGSCKKSVPCNCKRELVCTGGGKGRRCHWEEVCPDRCASGSGTRTARLRCVNGYPVALSLASECT